MTTGRGPFGGGGYFIFYLWYNKMFTENELFEILNFINYRLNHNQKLGIISYFQKLGIDIENGIGMDQLSEATLIVLHKLVYSKTYRQPIKYMKEMRGQRIFAHRKYVELNTTGSERKAICWLHNEFENWIHRSNTTNPPSRLQEILDECETNGFLCSRSPPIYVKPSCHYKRSCGLGAFSMVKILSGQYMCQFTGKVIKKTKNQGKFNSKGKLDYAMTFRYRGSEFVANPLDPTGTKASPLHMSAFINEPSRPPFDEGSIAEHIPTGRNVLIHKYRQQDAVYDVEFPDMSFLSVNPSELKYTGNQGSQVPEDKFTSNCFWADFPVPIETYGALDKLEDNTFQYELKNNFEPTVWYNKKEIHVLFREFQNERGLYSMTVKRSELVAPDDVLILKDGIFEGLCRSCLVLKIDSNFILVKHYIPERVWWRLPKIVLGYKVKRCFNCSRKEDSGDCKSCVRVVFPVIYACRNILPGEECLCLYSPKTDNERGISCTDTDQLLGEWNMYCEMRPLSSLGGMKRRPSWLPQNYKKL